MRRRPEKKARPLKKERARSRPIIVGQFFFFFAARTAATIAATTTTPTIAQT